MTSRKNTIRLSQIFNFIFSFLFCLTINHTKAQTDIPVGTWRMHLSFNNIKAIAQGSDRVYAASDVAVLIFDRTDNSLDTYTKLSGLTGAGITDIAYNENTNQLIIAYEDGNLDLIKENEVVNFTRLRDLNTIVGSKRINHITISNRIAYLSTDYGVVLLDLNNNEVKETWRDLGSQGTNLSIFKSIIYKDSISLATSKGVLIGSLKNNLLDYNNWKRIDSGELADTVHSIATFNNTLFIGINGKGLYQYNNQAFVNTGLLNDIKFLALEGAEENLAITGSQKLWLLNKNNQLQQIANDNLPSPQKAIIDQHGYYWIADAKNGLVSNISGTFTSFLPNGPTITSAFRLKHINNRLYALSGGYTSLGIPLGNDGHINYFENGQWKLSSLPLTDVTDIADLSNTTFTASYGSGISAETSSGSTIYNNTNSPLQNINPDGKGIYITALENSSQGVFVANYGAASPIHLLKQDNTWNSYIVNYALGRYPLRVASDFSSNLWMAIDPRQGGGIIVLNTQTGENIWLNESAGSGGLPSRAVRSLALDREGNIWVGTNSGIAYFYSQKADAVKPVFENRFLLRDEIITAIAIDGGNRKWIGTQQGAWLFNPTGESLVHRFTTENSPLPSNHISDISINHQTGEVFFSTDKGIISYRSDATVAEVKPDNIKIFPNPVTPEFSGTVGITGLSENASVKITDVSGKLVWQVQANGGTATWNVRDYKGRRAATGVYLVFASKDDGSESMVGKIAVIE
ncbi:two-component regulator propeller domain-containing protein [Chryseosolibacter indicus]|uniref:T9SS type A sorting domain-containing protein n=1 Tax=Chryseosolibacter indicus TaxID=2782351 RepID=A0ABS5VSZ9_9BACT|nr:two-component regulator propeller domain-containing protein [Chryseosolibacter indicus]MBT1704562.1 T9SS type A sorting domain-containing protein [Chryseosolibacter indicus]